MTTPSTVRVNQSYVGQRVTGQQRYAAEIARRLPSAQFVPLAPGPFWSRATLAIWVWVQAVLPLLAGRDLVLSMTSRAPFWRRRHILVVHDLFVLTNREWFSRLYYLTHAPLLRAQLRSAAAVVAVSQPVADQLAAVYAGPVVVAANAPSDVFSDTTDSSTAVTQLGLEPGRYLLAVGSMDPRKNLARLAQAYGRLSADERAAHPLVVVGGGSGIFKQQDLVWPQGTVDAGYLTDEQLAQLYRHAGTVVLASLAEGFGLPLVEAAAAGARNLLVSDIPVFRWICGHAAHYVDPESVESMADGLRRSLDGGPGGVVDLERFDWDRSASAISDLCDSVVGRTRVAA